MTKLSLLQIGESGASCNTCSLYLNRNIDGAFYASIEKLNHYLKCEQNNKISWFIFFSKNNHVLYCSIFPSTPVKF